SLRCAGVIESSGFGWTPLPAAYPGGDPFQEVGPMRVRSQWFSTLIFSSLSSLLSLFSLAGLAAVLFFTPSARAQQAYAHNLPKRIVADYGYWSKYQTPAYT